MSVIDEYFEKIEEPQRVKLERIRTIVKEIVPDAEEVLSYGMPAFKYRGHAFLGFNILKNHIGIYPFSSRAIEDLKDILSQYELSKGTIRVPLDEPIAENTLKQIIEYRIRQVSEVPLSNR